MFPLLLLSILTLTTALERGLFWIRLLIQEDRIVRDVLDAAAEDLAKAREIAEYARHLAIGVFSWPRSNYGGRVQKPSV